LRRDPGIAGQALNDKVREIVDSGKYLPETGAMPAPVAKSHVKAVRAFNRFYTQRIGVLKRYLDTDFTLTEVRVLYELAHRPPLSARDLVRDLELDAGYLSRMLRRFETEGWIARATAPHDARQSLLRLTEAGYATFAPLQQKSRDETAALLAAVAPAARPRLIQALQTVHQLLDPPAAPQRKIVLHDLRPGDIGWVVQAHGELYAGEYGFDTSFEALVAEIAAKFVRHFDPRREKAWIAEVAGQRAGCVFLVRKSETVAQLRLLLLRPEARGLGLGGRLTDECIAFARAQGYRKIRLWTQSNLVAARAIYASRGFVLKSSAPNTAFGQALVSEIWERKL
jgi:DNA-binding MarR family transcriptional regulator/GNAT superfamily N-acetyltransferase